MSSKLKQGVFYLSVLLVFSLVIYLIIEAGEGLFTGPLNKVQQAEALPETFSHNLQHPLAILLLQIITIIVAARLFGYVFKKLGQPMVIGEIAAGIFLGPSFIGMYFPGFSEFLFPEHSLDNLQFLSQIGLILFMFVVGMELDLSILKNKAREAVIISHASILFPFTLGIALAYFIYGNYAPPGVNFLSFALFTGIAMSITAFPVLARIVQEKDLTRTRLGTIAITCAAADDITAWCMLAIVIAIVKAGTIVSALITVAMAVAYVLLMLLVLRPFLNRLGEKFSNRESLSKPVVAIFFGTLIFSAYCTEVIGIHALFGAFMAGVIMPPNMHFRNTFIEKVEDISLVLLLPLFFVFTGLRTEIGLLNTGALWLVCLVIVAVAVIGKVGGSAFAARMVGQSWRDSLIIGALMNTRGLMELVVLNIGYDLGVMTPEVFAMMVIMALLTTVMTSPSLSLINRLFRNQVPFTGLKKIEKGLHYNLLISFGSPQKAVPLLRVAKAMTGNKNEKAVITAMHLSPSQEISQYNFHEFETESFAPVKKEAERLRVPLNIFFKPSRDIEEEISETANQGFDFLLIGIGTSVLAGTFLGKLLGFTTRIMDPQKWYESITGREKLFQTGIFDDKIKNILKSTNIPVGILVDRNLDNLNSLFVPVFTAGDLSILPYAQKFVRSSAVKIILHCTNSSLLETAEFREEVKELNAMSREQVKVSSDAELSKESLKHSQLLLSSLEGWKTLVESESAWVPLTPSVLIIRP